MYIGGDFTQLTPASGPAVTRNRIARVNGDGSINAWNPNANRQVLALSVSGSTVFVGGGFTTIGGQARNGIAALDASGNATAWNPNVNDFVYALALSGSTIYAGGSFGNIGGQPRNYIAALDATTGNATAWNPNANDDMHGLAVSGSMVFVGGGFTTIGGQARPYFAAVGPAAQPTPTPAPREVPEADTLLLLGGGLSGLGVWLRWRWSKRCSFLFQLRRRR